MSTPVSLTADTIVCASVQVGEASPYFYSAVKVALNGVEYGVPQFVRFYDQPSLFVDRGCSKYTTCTKLEFEQVVPTPTSDRICVAIPGKTKASAGKSCSVSQ